MEIEHELAERPLEPSQRAAQNDESRPGQLSGSRKIHHTEPLADCLVGQRFKIETRRLAMVAQHPICRLVRPVRHLFGGKVREAGEDLLDLGAQPGRLGTGLGFDVPVLARLSQQRGYVLAALLGGADLSGDAVAPRLRFLGTSLGGAPQPVERQDLLGAARQAAPRQASVEFRRVVTDPSEIVHSTMGYRGPAWARPSGSRPVKSQRQASPCR